ncbi:pyridoxal phosphate-dependent decarboxylase family protein [Persicimonas caeni]|nr:pyridoxal-dependent decarboxylase [Persicimonas caeni]
MSIEELHPWFLGAYAENHDVLEDLLTEFLADHVYWRRNFHPECRPPVPTSAQYRDDYIEFVAELKQELFQLSADLKRSVPWFSPRYVGHMSSDLLLPGLIARVMTTLYNPNNVSEDASPATLEKELEVGMQLAEMFGYPIDESAEPCAYGHLTSGGTVANYEGLRNLIALEMYPMALAQASREFDGELGPMGPLVKRLTEYSDWELVNLGVDDIIALRREALGSARELHGPAGFERFRKAIKAARFEALGAVDFFRTHSELKPPVVLVPSTAHYSWEKAMKVLGLGAQHLLEVGVDRNMRMDVAQLRTVLEQCLDQKVPVLALVGVLGNTEFGTVDPIGELMNVRDEFSERGLHAPVHIDAAWGGYLASVFRAEGGGLVGRDMLKKKFHYFPSQTVYEAFAALGRTDSITVDPHKLGYVPYPAGAYVARNRGMIEFLTQEAAYVFDIEEESHQRSLADKLRHLGQYILEGSKPGSAAASAYVTHRVLPLHHDGFGRILQQTIRSCEYFYDAMPEFKERVGDLVNLTIPFEPDSNLVCLAINPRANDSLARMNCFGRRLFEHMKIDPKQPIQQREFVASYTSLLAERVSDERAAELLGELGIDPASLTPNPSDAEGQADHVFLIRNTLMNPWLLHEQNGKNYIDLYLDYLERIIRQELEG